MSIPIFERWEEEDEELDEEAEKEEVAIDEHVWSYNGLQSC